MAEIDRGKSLQELEGVDWGEPAFNSGLVTECHRLRRVPLHEFNAENLRVMIGQQISLPHLIPLALELLRNNPFAEGHFYKGDMLVAVLRAEQAFWLEHIELRQEVAAIAERALSQVRSSHDDDLEIAREELPDAYRLFQPPGNQM